MIKGFKKTYEPHEEWDLFCEANETWIDQINTSDVDICIDKRLEWIYPRPDNIEQMRENWVYVDVWKRLLSLKEVSDESVF